MVLKEECGDLFNPPLSSCLRCSSISLLLERILTQLLPFVPAHLSSTEDCMTALRNLENLPEECIVASLDVVSLYSNIPIQESIDAAIELLEEHEESVDMFALSLSEIREMLMFVLESNFFEFDGAIYRQQQGLAMGNHLAPPLAIIFMSKFESRALSEYPLKPLLYRRYIDDCILVWIFGIAAFLAFVDYLNSRHPRIQFTAEYTHTTNSHTISYLDLSISVSGGKLDWELFVKSSHSGVHLSYLSALPMETKIAVANNQISRAVNNATTEAGRQRGIEKITTLLLENHYPRRIIQSAIQHSDTARTTARIREQPHQQTPHRKGKRQYTSLVKVPYVNDQLARRVRQVVRSFDRDVRVVFTSGRSLKDMLVSSSFSKPQCPRTVQRQREKRGRGRPAECRACDGGLKRNVCMSQDVVYSMKCTICQEEYVGETERTTRKRTEEHYRQAKNATLGEPWGDHYRQKQHTFPSSPQFSPFSHLQVLASKQRSYVDRRIMEALFMRKRKPAVNSDNGWRLLGDV